jgi:hypothetical protein
MLGFSPKLPVTDEERQWVDQGFARLEKMLGRERVLRARVILPIPEYFPDPYDETPASAEMMFQRLCTYMGVEPRGIDFEVFPDETEQLRKILPYWSSASGGCAGLYMHGSGEDGDGNGSSEKRMVVAVRSTQLKDPLALAATLAHELGHVILLGGGLLDPTTPDHEPMTDLLTVFLGLGIFNANTAARFHQYQDETHQGWSMQRQGYLPETVFGYALARFAAARGEDRPAWTRHLSTNVREYFKRSRKWIEKNERWARTGEPIR